MKIENFFLGLIFTTAHIVFITAKIAFIFTSLSALYTYDFHIFTVIYSSLHGFIWNQHIEQLLIGLLAQTVEHGTDIAEVVGSNPPRGLNFSSGLMFTAAYVAFITAMVAFSFTSLSAVHIYDFHAFTAI